MEEDSRWAEWVRCGQGGQWGEYEYRAAEEEADEYYESGAAGCRWEAGDE